MVLLKNALLRKKSVPSPEKLDTETDRHREHKDRRKGTGESKEQTDQRKSSDRDWILRLEWDA